MHLSTTVLLTLALTCSIAHASDSQAERLSNATEQFAKCLDNTLGNFTKEEDAQVATRRISAAMLHSIRALVLEERKKPESEAHFWIETLGQEAFVGYLFKSFSDVSEDYKAERQSLKVKNKFDWRRTQQQLWSKYGCDAIYSQLPR
jgi:hypothetical protein